MSKYELSKQIDKIMKDGERQAARSKHEVYKQIDKIMKSPKRSVKENLTDADKETDRRINELLAEAWRCQQELDPIVRETFRDNPEALAEWDEIMHMCDDLPSEEHSDPELPSS